MNTTVVGSYNKQFSFFKMIISIILLVVYIMFAIEDFQLSPKDVYEVRGGFEENENNLLLNRMDFSNNMLHDEYIGWLLILQGI